MDVSTLGMPPFGVPNGQMPTTPMPTGPPAGLLGGALGTSNYSCPGSEGIPRIIVCSFSLEHAKVMNKQAFDLCVHQIQEGLSHGGGGGDGRAV